MERRLERWILAWVLLLLIPWAVSLCWMQKGKGNMQEEPAAQTEIQTEIQTEAQTMEAAEVSEMQSEERKILMEQDGIYTHRNLEDYLPGVVFLQTDFGTEFEALKCQAVIARTYICRLMDGKESIDEVELNLPEMAGSFGKSDETVRALELCEQAVRETNGMIMVYEDQCILPLFHKISSGRTRTGDVDFPYLQAVESSHDSEAEGYRTEVSWNPSEFAKKIGNDSGMTAETLISEMQVIQKDDSGYVQKMKIGAKIYSGEELQYALELPSSCFSIYSYKGSVCARVSGIGHGYGLSQAGARAMARDGWGYEEILHYYYKNISIVSE